MGVARRASALLVATLLFTTGTAHAEAVGPVAGNETLWSVARTLKGNFPGATTAQVAWALYRRNPDAFEGAPDRIRAGSTLELPEAAQVVAVDPQSAHAYVTGTRKPPAAPAAPPAARPVPEPMSAQDPLAAVVLNPQLAARQPVDNPPPAAAPATPAAAFRPSQDAQSLPADPAARYRRLRGLEAGYAGDPDFDYLYGMAALDSGHSSEAVFILQRTVSARPGFSGARMDLARAYYAVGDNESARREFETLKGESPPPEARRAIDDYLSAVDQRAASYEPKLGAFVEGSAGFDTNANGGPDSRDFLGFTLDPRNQATESAYYALGLGGQGSYPLAPSWRLVGDARLQHRTYPEASFVDGDTLRVGAGIAWSPGPFTLGLTPNFILARLDGKENNQSPALDLAVAWNPGESWRLALDARYAQLRYIDALSIQDVTSTLAGIGIHNHRAGTPSLQLSATVTGGRDEADTPGSPFGRDLIGARLAAALDFGRGRVLSLAASGLDSDFDGTFFGESRSDRQRVGTLALDWGLDRAAGWLLRGQVTYINNASGVDLYDYDRIDSGISLMKEFR